MFETQRMDYDGMAQLQRGLASLSSSLEESEKALRYALDNLSGSVSSRASLLRRLEELLRAVQEQDDRLADYRQLLELAARRRRKSVEESRRLAAASLSAGLTGAAAGAAAYAGRVQAAAGALAGGAAPFPSALRDRFASSLGMAQEALQNPNSAAALPLKTRAAIEKGLTSIFPARGMSDEERQAIARGLSEKLSSAGTGSSDWIDEKISAATGWVGDRIVDAAQWADGTLSEIPGLGKAWQDITESDMAKYLFELGMDGLGLICDTGSFFKNMALLNWAEAGLDGYDILNGVYATGGDMSAVFAEGMSYFFEGEDKEFWKNEAREASQLGGLADVLRDEELNELAAVADMTDAIHGGVKTGVGADKLLTFGTAVKADQATLGEVFEAATGFKTGSGPLDKLENLKTGLEYADGIRNGDLKETYIEHTMPGKVYKGGKGSLESIQQAKEDISGGDSTE